MLILRNMGADRLRPSGCRFAIRTLAPAASSQVYCNVVLYCAHCCAIWASSAALPVGCGGPLR